MLQNWECHGGVILPRVAVLKNGTAGDQDFRTRAHNTCYRLVVNAAVHFNPEL